MLHTARKMIDRVLGPSEEVLRHAQAVADQLEPWNWRGYLVVAGNYRQSQDWAREQGWSKADFIRLARYVPSMERFHGYRPDQNIVVFTGTWLQDNPDAMEIHRWANVMGFEIIE